MEKQYEVKITHHAEFAMRQIVQFIAWDLQEPGTAVRLLSQLRAGIRRLDHLPQRVHRTPEEPWHSLGVRRLLIKHYYIYFWVDEQNSRVQITDVIYAGREQTQQLQAMPLPGGPEQ